ncbi:hypothetical protein DERF_008701 [Dermatophagoides farinae]|uniref:Uncharacterized protein n=1 Tax=Dermatophagoides farinae TaxID=6954 RepID=A0A922I272_DERFA|nr:hypothetical protein DERF_008701 [Dermatophagoides farinae]
MVLLYFAITMAMIISVVIWLFSIQYCQTFNSTSPTPIPWLFTDGYDKKITCGVHLLNETIAISIMGNRIYQFTFDLSVTMYNKDKHFVTNHMYMEMGLKFSLKTLNPIFIDMGVSLKSRLDAFTVKSLHENIAMALIKEENKDRRFQIFVKDTNHNCYRGACHSTLTNKVIANFQLKYDQHEKFKFVNIIMISAENSAFVIIIDKDSKGLHFQFINTTCTNAYTFGYICLLKSKRLRAQNNEDHCNSDDDMIIGQGSINHVQFSQIEYGFTGGGILHLVSYQQKFVLTVDQRLLYIFDQDYPYQIISFLDFFRCRKWDIVFENENNTVDDVNKLATVDTNDDNVDNDKHNTRGIIIIIIVVIVLAITFIIFPIYFFLHKRKRSRSMMKRSMPWNKAIIIISSASRNESNSSLSSFSSSSSSSSPLSGADDRRNSRRQRRRNTIDKRRIIRGTRSPNLDSSRNLHTTTITTTTSPPQTIMTSIGGSPNTTSDLLFPTMNNSSVAKSPHRP